MANDQSRCPTCQQPLESAGRTERCKTCDGAWIHEDVLVGMLQESTSTLVVLPWHPREPEGTPRGCAVCGTAMQPVKLGTVALDRCAEHGVWFDKHELEAMFHDAKQVASEGRAQTASDTSAHRGWLRSLARLFGR